MLWRKKLGYPNAASILGKNIFDFQNEEISQAHRAVDLEVIQTKEPREVEEQTLSPEGKKIVYLTQKKPLLDSDGNVLGLVGVSIDITHRKEMEQLQLQLATAEALAKTQAEMAQALAGMSCSVAHDIRTPLTAARMRVEVAEPHQDVLLMAYKKCHEMGGLGIPVIPPRQLQALGILCKELLKNHA